MAIHKHIQHTKKDVKKRRRGRRMKNEWNWMIIEETTENEGEEDE